MNAIASEKPSEEISEIRQQLLRSQEKLLVQMERNAALSDERFVALSKLTDATQDITRLTNEKVTIL